MTTRRQLRTLAKRREHLTAALATVTGMLAMTLASVALVVTR